MTSERVYEVPDAPSTYSDHYMLVDKSGAVSATKVRIDAFKTWLLEGYASGYVGGNIATLTNGTAAAGQKTVTVLSTEGFIAGGYAAYTRVDDTVEYNLIATVTDLTHLLLTTNIGASGIGDAVFVGMISPEDLASANAIPHAGTLVMPSTIAYANRRVFNVEAYGASPTASGAVNSAAFQAAIDAATEAGGGSVEIPFVASRYALSTGLTLETSSVSIHGHNSVILCDADIDFLAFGGNTTIFSSVIEGLIVHTNGGHGLTFGAANAYLSSLAIRDCAFYTAGDGAGFYMPTGSAMAGVLFENCIFETTISGTMAPFTVASATPGAFNHCTLRNCWFQLNKNVTVPGISIASTDSGSWFYGNAFRDIVFEQCPKGAVSLQGVWGNHLENCAVYDQTETTTGHMFAIGKHSTGLASRYCVLTNCSSIGAYTPGINMYGIDLTDGGYGATLVNCNGTDPDYNINIASSAVTIINCTAPIVGGDAWDVALSPAKEVIKLPVKLDTGDPTSPQEGWMYVNKYDNKVLVYADAAWRTLATW